MHAGRRDAKAAKSDEENPTAVGGTPLPSPTVASGVLPLKGQDKKRNRFW